jgi:DNA uptake protein ComE-like DNA-binding protein
MVLRSAIAAMNLMGLRDQGFVNANGTITSNNVYSRTITLYDTPTDSTPPNPAVPPKPRFQATVFSTARQPFITEVLAYNLNDAATTPHGYVAIELHNPYPVPLDVSGWQVATLDRRNPRPGPIVPASQRYPTTPVYGANVDMTKNPPPDDYANMVYRPLALGIGRTNPGLLPNTIIPAHGYLVLENYDPAGAADPTRAISRPPFAQTKLGTLPVDARIQYVPNLSDVMGDGLTIPGGEFVLLRPRRGDGVPSKTADWNNKGMPFLYDNFDEGTAAIPKLADWVPIDSFDFTGFKQVAAPPFSRLHYCRGSYGVDDSTIPHTPLQTTSLAQWKCVYPGRYNGNYYQARNQGTEIAVPFNDYASEPAPNREITLGYGEQYSSWQYRLGTDPPPPDPNNDFAFTQMFVTPLCEWDWPGHNALFDPTTGALNAQPYHWPYGMFARVGDLLKVPYIGAYVLREVEESAAGTVPPGAPDRGTLLGTKILAASSAPTHPDGSPVLDYELLLEVNPVTMDAMFAEDTQTANNLNEDIGRFCPDTSNYGWASDLLNYFTVTHNYADDYMPNINPVQYWRLTGLFSQRVGNDGARPENANEGNEDSVAAHGLININTAPAEVLNMLPLVIDPGTKKIDPVANLALANAIVAYRSDPTKGPFKSLFDLNLVKDAGGNGFQNAMGKIVFGTTDPDDEMGDLSPYNGGVVTGTDGVMNDFEERYLQLARLSNLLTVRSDSFNVYVLVQSWKNVGSTTIPPMLTWEKRIAFTADRSTVDPATQARILKTTDIPAD